MSSDENLYPWRKKENPLASSISSPILRLIRVGHIHRLLPTMEKEREKMGLQRLPPSAFSSKDAVSEVNILLQYNLSDKVKRRIKL